MLEIIPNWHPIVVHFAIGLLLSSVAFYTAGILASGRAIGARLTSAGRWNLAVGVIAAALAVLTGWFAYNSVAHDGPSHANMTVHMRWALGSLAVFILVAAAAWRDRARAAGGSALLIILLLTGAGVLGVTGWYGAENVYRHGLGVMRLPDADDHHHAQGVDRHDEHGSENVAHEHPAGGADESTRHTHEPGSAPHEDK